MSLVSPGGPIVPSLCLVFWGLINVSFISASTVFVVVVLSADSVLGQVLST